MGVFGRTASLRCAGLAGGFRSAGRSLPSHRRPTLIPPQRCLHALEAAELVTNDPGIDPLVANEGLVASRVKADSRRRRGPKGRLCKLRQSELPTTSRKLTARISGRGGKRWRRSDSGEPLPGRRQPVKAASRETGARDRNRPRRQSSPMVAVGTRISPRPPRTSMDRPRVARELRRQHIVAGGPGRLCPGRSEAPIHRTNPRNCLGRCFYSGHLDIW
jgi:hypothetical protein